MANLSPLSSVVLCEKDSYDLQDQNGYFVNFAAWALRKSLRRLESAATEFHPFPVISTEVEKSLPISYYR